ncbi:MAG: hypothetical protein ACK52W_06730, partial [Alphaproteobacteria bacterium]
DRGVMAGRLIIDSPDGLDLAGGGVGDRLARGHGRNLHSISYEDEQRLIMVVIVAEIAKFYKGKGQAVSLEP